MSQYTPVNLTKSKNDYLKKTVKNFNAKISRLEKKLDKQIAAAKDPDERQRLRNRRYALPDRVTTKQMKDLISTEQDRNRELRALKRFSERGQEEFVKVPNVKDNTIEITKWQKNIIVQRTGQINKKRAERKEMIINIDVKSRGENLGYQVGDIGMGKADEIALSPLNAFTPAMERRDIKKKFLAILQESKDSYWREKEIRLKQNVINGIKANYHGLFPEDTDAIIEQIEQLSFEEFYNIFMGESGVMEIVSPPPGMLLDDLMEINMEALKSTWLPDYKSPIQDQVNDIKHELAVKEQERKLKAKERSRRQKAAQKRFRK